MTSNERAGRKHATSRRVPGILLRLVLAWFGSAIALAVAAPALRSRSMGLEAWMIWTVILVAVALALAPEWRRHRRI